jgi:hypothetical protein
MIMPEGYAIGSGLQTRRKGQNHFAFCREMRNIPRGSKTLPGKGEKRWVG